MKRSQVSSVPAPHSPGDVSCSAPLQKQQPYILLWSFEIQPDAVHDKTL